MDDIAQIIGANLKRIRLESNSSLDRISSLTGISKSMLSEIENGKKSPTISLLIKLCDGLRITLSDITSPPEPDVDFRSSEDIDFYSYDDGIRTAELFHNKGKTIEIFEQEWLPEAHSPMSQHGPNTREFLLLTKGELQVLISGETYLLHSGDTLSFKGSLSHQYINLSPLPAKGIVVLGLE